MVLPFPSWGGSGPLPGRREVAPGRREDLPAVPTPGGSSPSAPPRRRIFTKRVTQMSWPRFVYILGNCCGKGKKKKNLTPFDILSNIGICAFDRPVGPRKLGLRTGDSRAGTKSAPRSLACIHTHTRARPHPHTRVRAHPQLGETAVRGAAWGHDLQGPDGGPRVPVRVWASLQGPRTPFSQRKRPRVLVLNQGSPIRFS